MIQVPKDILPKIIRYSGETDAPFSPTKLIAIDRNNDERNREERHAIKILN